MPPQPTSETSFGPVPEANQPGHHPEVEQDKPRRRPPTPKGSIPRTTTWDFRYDWPVAGYERPPALGTYDVFPTVAARVGAGEAPPVPVASLWDGLEAFVAYDDETEPALLRAAVVEALGLEPDAVGLVDHGAIGDDWERTGGRVSVVEALFRQLAPEP